MQEIRIRLSPMEKPEPYRSRIPYHHSRRWLSPGEDDGQISPAVSVFVTQRAFVRFCAYAGSDLENEVGGFLIGKWQVDIETNEQFIVIDTVLPAHHTRQGAAFLTFTHDSIVAMHNNLETYYPEKELVGWFHTHPRMGIFFSEMDTWLHMNFFPEKWQVALVIEPHSATGGFFIQQTDGFLDPRQYFGFYEIMNHRERSVVYWRNMLLDTRIVTSDMEDVL